MHIGRNIGATPVIWEIIYLNPPGKPLAEDTPEPRLPLHLRSASFVVS